jgi:hypothetical protein
MAFLEGVALVGTIQAVRAWFHGDLLKWGGLEWRTLREPGQAPLELAGEPDRAALSCLLADGRARVVDTLRDWLATPGDDAFLQELVARGFVQRTAERWVARVPSDRYLSELVLALLGADMLGRRAVYEARLSICDACDRVGFVPTAPTRHGCAQHPTAKRDFRSIVRARSSGEAHAILASGGTRAPESGPRSTGRKRSA